MNAFYNPSMNDINFPAGVLQPAFFDATQPEAVNYGHIGLFMGHEITHGFDDQGRQFDGHGNLEGLVDEGRRGKVHAEGAVHCR